MIQYIKVRLLIIVFALFSVAGINGCTRTEAKPQNELLVQGQIASDISPQKFDELSAKGNGEIVDVRTPEECQSGLIAGAKNINFNAGDFQAKIGELDRSKPVYLYCRSGRRSGLAMVMMQEMGFNEVYNLSGGVLAWSEAGLPLNK
jgi:rhodanese-related sulfurtransferase